MAGYRTTVYTACNQEPPGYVEGLFPEAVLALNAARRRERAASHPD